VNAEEAQQRRLHGSKFDVTAFNSPGISATPSIAEPAANERVRSSEMAPVPMSNALAWRWPISPHRNYSDKLVMIMGMTFRALIIPTEA